MLRDILLERLSEIGKEKPQNLKYISWVNSLHLVALITVINDNENLKFETTADPETLGLSWAILAAELVITNRELAFTK